jgi:type VI secretion system protein ImpC
MAKQAKQEEGVAAAVAPAEEASLLDSIVAQSRIFKGDEERQRGKDLIKGFVDEVMKGTITVSGDVAASIEARIAEIDKLISKQLSVVMHSEPFQKLEGSWRGLNYLVRESRTGTNLKIKVLNCSKKDLVKDMRNSPSYDQTALFKKIYSEEYDVFGGSPYAAMIGDYEFGRDQQDIYLLEKISEVAAASHAPFMSAASSDMFGQESFTNLLRPSKLDKIFDTVEYARWKTFRNSDNARYVGLTLPHVLGRPPYDPKSQLFEEFKFEEDVSGKDHGKYLWSNAAYALGARMTDAFFNYGWCAAIRGMEGGGKVTGLPMHTFTTDDGETVLKCPTEIAIPETREKELADLGFIPLVHYKDTDTGVFISAQSCNKAKEYDDPAASASSRLSSQLQYIMAVSRFAHYFKAIMRDKLGGFMSRVECEKFLKRWLMQYVVEDDEAGPKIKAEKPLREANIEVVEVPGKPGVYRAVAFLRPHFQLDELSIAMRLVAELPKSAK